VNLLLVGKNCCAKSCTSDIVAHHAQNHFPLLLVKSLWSILSVLPTAVNDTREGEGVTRELATGSITSSRVMELMSNQASEMFQAKFCEQYMIKLAADAAVVNVAVQRVQSTVPVSVLEFVVAQRVPAELYSSTVILAEFEGTFVVFTKQDILYFVLHLTGIIRLRFASLCETTKRPVTSVVESLRVFVPVLVTAVSNSAETLVATRVIYHQNLAFSINQLAVTGISPVALSILISSPHCEARVVVVVVQAVQ